jgi:hypothetical protein
MERKRIKGVNWVWICPKCDRRSESAASQEDIARYRAQRKAAEERARLAKQQSDRVAASEARGDAPEGEDAELWAMRRVMTQDFEHDVGPRQQFYRRLYDDEPFRFAKMMQDREAFLKKEAAAVTADKDEGVERSLELAESLLGEVAKPGVAS